MRLKKNTAGLTLIEVIVSLAILGIIIIAILNTFTFGFDTIFSMGRKTKAAQIAQQYMDECYNSYPFNTTAFNTVINTPTSVTGYIIDTANSTISGPTNQLYTVKITVIYPKNRSVSLTALVPENLP